MNPWAIYQSMTRDPAQAKTVGWAVVRRIFTYARPYRRQVIAFLITLVIASLLTVAQPLVFRQIIDNGISQGNGTLVTVLAIVVAVLALLDAAIGLIGRWYSSKIGEGLIYDLRTQVYDHVQRQSVAFFTRAQTGALVSRLNSDVIGAQQAFTSTLGGVVGNLITVTIVLITMFLLSWQVTILSLILVPLFLLPARWMGRRLQALTKEQMQVNAQMSTQMTERFNVSGALLVSLFGKPAREHEDFSQRAAQVRDSGISIAMANRWFFTALLLVGSIATAITYGVGGNLVIGGSITLGTLLALVALLAQLYGPLTALSNVRVDVMTALVSFERVFEILDLPPLVRDAPHAKPVETGPLGVSFDRVGFRYPSAAEVSLASLESVAREGSSRAEEPVLHDVSFDVLPGQLVALVGPSGAGKTTITSLVPRLYDVTSGSVRVGGHDVRDLEMSSLRDAVGVVTQDAHLFHDTIGNNLRYARPDASDEDIRDALRGAHILDLIDSLPDGLDTVVGDRGYRLSGGEKQRIAIARLLLKAPRVVILDEATAHLDSESESAVQQALAEALRGRTSLVIAHRLSTVRQADVILVIEEGRVVERGTHDELLAKSGLYATLYATQFED
ncbi:MAG: ABC transporter ATP-binding protein/permease [Candidatus Nanopelagicales bacterium]|nr:ABC transporter ATP-binding protein/permease [Candidatus Nanopelagicales bacterium]MDP4716075.1 ABC transporter ATP-binding protein/permease [Candidatus Nanopelagicales bacterium]MDP4906492.1 ABC transporter ATP-binding protein/permease [Candidatus Nanopelagicales bacterium]MDP4975858.1 ABC transporter ATP-binding protein/permease [Candidatus Nanopelagicales bacterium]MDP5096058.1 ABC transporter ATP-binding protein/permease [Candidatus Nanopelagicales bacterium]